MGLTRGAGHRPTGGRARGKRGYLHFADAEMEAQPEREVAQGPEDEQGAAGRPDPQSSPALLTQA